MKLDEYENSVVNDCDALEKQIRKIAERFGNEEISVSYTYNQIKPLIEEYNNNTIKLITLNTVKKLE